MVNPIGAGFLAGGILARNAGPKAAFGGGIAFAAFSAAIDLFLRRETAELVPLITIAFLITHANQIIARIEVASILFALYRLIFIVGYHTLYSNLTHYLTTSLAELKHEHTGTPVVRVLSRVPGRKLKSVGEQADSGSTISFIFLTVCDHSMMVGVIRADRV